MYVLGNLKLPAIFLLFVTTVGMVISLSGLSFPYSAINQCPKRVFFQVRRYSFNHYLHKLLFSQVSFSCRIVPTVSANWTILTSWTNSASFCIFSSGSKSACLTILTTETNLAYLCNLFSLTYSADLTTFTSWTYSVNLCVLSNLPVTVLANFGGNKTMWTNK